MKKLKGLMATLAVVGVGFLGLFAVQVSADTDKVVAAECTNGTKYTDFDGSYSGRNTMTVWPKRPLCKDVHVNFGSFTINNTYNGQGFKNNPTALPQTLFYNKTVILKKGTTGRTTVTVKVPDPCKDFQIDAYIGPVQHKITTNAGLVGTTAITAKAFQRLETDCSPKMVKVCDPVTGKIIFVPEADADKYKPVDDKACQPVKVCDPATGEIITVKASEADNYKPVGDAACKSVQVCDPATGQIITVKKAKADDYKPVDDEACAETPETPVTPETPSTPQVMGETTTTETPAEIPSTGPEQAIAAMMGAGSLAGAGTAYIRSRRNLK